MSERRKSYLITLCFAAVITGGVIYFSLSRYNVIDSICNGLFVAAVLVGGCGLLAFANKHGAFDMFTFAVSWLIHIRYLFKKGEKRETYAEYKVRKSGERTYSVSPLIVGALLFGLSLVVFMISKFI